MKKKILVLLMSFVMVASVAAPVCAQGVEASYRDTQYYGSVLSERICTKVTTDQNALNVENYYCDSSNINMPWHHYGQKITYVSKKTSGATTATYSYFVAKELAKNYEIYYQIW